MDVSPNALYSNLLSDLSSVIQKDLLEIYIERKDFPVGASPKEVAAIQIARSLVKKYRHPSNDMRDAVALLKFLETNNRCKNWSLQLNTSHDEELIGEFKSAIYSFWHDGWEPLVGHHYDLLDHGGVGPGASIEGRGSDFYTKLFDSPLSCTRSSLYFWYKRYVDQFPTWKEAENARLQARGLSVVAGNRLDFVPKNDETSRTICIEPTLNMFYQLGMGAILELRLKKHFGLNLADQQFKNRELARQGSVTGRYVTLDLESASDSMSISMLKDMLPRDFFSWLQELRSPVTDIPGIGPFASDMISTMGNGFTFPLQTMLFAAVVIAAMKLRGIRPAYPRGQCWGNFGVNGDDIIVPEPCARDVVHLLQLLGFRINRDKSFEEGPFRESCGGDYFLGHPVRGVYVKALDTPQARYVAINQLNLFSSRTGVSLPKTVQTLLKTVRFLPVPRWEMDDAGIRLPFSLLRIPPNWCSKTQSLLYWKWEPYGKKIRISESAIFVPRNSKPRKYNPNGLLLSFLQRAVNSCKIGVRQDPILYRKRRHVAPNWDCVSPDWTSGCTRPFQGGARFAAVYQDERFTTAVYLNMNY
jgi:hypothetical protein